MKHEEVGPVDVSVVIDVAGVRRREREAVARDRLEAAECKLVGEDVDGVRVRKWGDLVDRTKPIVIISRDAGYVPGDSGVPLEQGNW